MIDDEAIFPHTIAIGSEGGPGFSTDVTAVASGFERRNQNWATPLLSWDVAPGVKLAADYMLLRDFFMSRRGRARGFRFPDWADESSGGTLPAFDDQVLGIGDGSRIFWLLSKVYGSGETALVRRITRPRPGSVRIGLGGIEQASGWTVDHRMGLVTFDAPPPVGVVVTAGFLFDVPARFDIDRLPVAWLAPDVVQVPQIPVVEIRE